MPQCVCVCCMQASRKALATWQNQVNSLVNSRGVTDDPIGLKGLNQHYNHVYVIQSLVMSSYCMQYCNLILA